MVLLQRSKAGRYATTRYERGLRAYRRRIRWPLLVVVLPILAFGIGVMLSHKIDPWSLAAGAAIAVGIATGPAGAFLLETKNLAGTISVEDGALVARQFDDPGEVFRYRSLAPRLRGQAKELSARLQAETGHRTWITALVVIWGHFPQGLVSSGNVTYIHGDRITDWLASQSPRGTAAK